MNRELIFDVGMHNGDDTAYYLHRGHCVIAIEANPALAAQGAVRFSDAIAAGRLLIRNVAIAERPGVLPFWICEPHTEWSSFTREIAARDGSPHHRIDIEAVTFETLLAQHGVPYYLKVDIEGNDHLCVTGLRRDDLPAYVSMETSPATVALLPHLHALGYTGFKCISQFDFLPLEDPPAREQRRFERALRLAEGRDRAARLLRHVVPWGWVKRDLEGTRIRGDWRFPRGSSGPFGDDTPGRWLNCEEVRRVYARYAGRYQRREASPYWNLDHDYSFWTDFHARRDH